MFTPLQVPCAQHITLPVCTYEKLAHIYGFGSWGVFVFHPSVLSGCWTEQPSPEYFLLPVQVPNSDFCKIFQKRFRSPNGTLEFLKVYDPHIWSRNMTIFFLSLRLICGVYG